MHDLGRNEDRLRGTYEFPFEFHHIDSTHPRYVMSYHWHVECEIMRILQGTLTVTLDEKSFTAKAGDVIFVNSGVLHSGIPHDCIYQCIVFDMNMFLKFNSVCTEYMQKISHQELLIYHHFTEKHPDIQRSVNSLLILSGRRNQDTSWLYLDNFTTFSDWFLVIITTWKVCGKPDVITNVSSS